MICRWWHNLWHKEPQAVAHPMDQEHVEAPEPSPSATDAHKDQIATLEKTTQDLHAQLESAAREKDALIGEIASLTKEIADLKSAPKTVIQRCPQGHAHNAPAGEMCPACENGRLREAMVKEANAVSWQDVKTVWDPSKETAVECIKRLNSKTLTAGVPPR